MHCYPKPSPGTRCILTYLTTLCFALLALPPGVLAATSYNAADDFSPTLNPSGTWDYGSRATLTDPFVAYDTTTHAGTVLDYWRTAATPDPSLGHNGTAAPVAAFDYTVQPNQLCYHPGASGELTVLRWTAPQAGKFAVHADWVGLGANSTTDAYVLVNGTVLNGTADFPKQIRGQGSTASYDTELTVAAGDRVEFALNYGASLPSPNYTGDNTGVNVTITEKVVAADSRILYIKSSSGPGELALMAPDGQSQVGLNNSSVSAVTAALSADGQFAAFNSLDGGLYVIKAAPVSGTNVPANVIANAAVTANFGASATWSPNGRYLAFQGSDSHIYLLQVRDAGGTFTPFQAGTNPLVDVATSFSSAANPVWSPDGRYLALAEGSSVLTFPVVDSAGVITPATPASTVTLTDPNVSQSEKTSVAWSADGSKIAFVETLFVPNHESRVSILTVRDSAGAFLLESGTNPRLPLYAFTDTPLAEAVSWSSDGTLLAISASTAGQSNVYTFAPAPVNGANPRVAITTTVGGGGRAPVFATGLALPIPNFTLDSDIDTQLPYSSANPWTFKARLTQPLPSSTVVRVQSSTTPNTEASWTDIPGAAMDNNGPDPGIGTAQTWVATTSQVPNPVDLYFRVVATATGRAATVSVVRGPFPPSVGLKTPDFTLDTDLRSTTPLQNGKRWDFTTRYGGAGEVVPAGFQLILQTSSNPASEGSWTELVEFTRSTPTSLTWIASSNAVPANTSLSFRVAAQAPGLNAGTSVVRGPFNVGSPSVALFVTCTASTQSDPAVGDPPVGGRTGTLGESITYTLKVRNGGGVAAQRMQLINKLPKGLNVDRLHVEPAGKVNASKTQVFWEIASLAADSEELTFTFDALIDDDKALLGQTLTNGDLKFFEQGNAENFATPDVVPQTVIGSPLQITSIAVQQANNVYGGLIVEYIVTVKNLSGLPTQNVVVTVPVPVGSTLRLSGITFADFLSGDDIALRLPAWPLRVVASGGAPFFGKNPAVSVDQRTIYYKVGSLKPAGQFGSAIKLKYSVRVQYGRPAGYLLTNGGFSGTFNFRGGKKIDAVTAGGAALRTLVAPPTNARPIVYITYLHEGVGFDSQKRVVATAAATKIPNTNPVRKTNEIYCRGLYLNYGDVPAENLVGYFQIPAEADFDRTSLVVNGTPVKVPSERARLVTEQGLDVPEIEPEPRQQKFLMVQLPFLDVTSSGDYKFTLKIAPRTKTDTIITSRAVIVCADLVESIIASQPNVLETHVVKPGVLEEGIERLKPLELADDAPFQDTHTFTNTGGLPVKKVTVDIPIPPGAKFSSFKATLGGVPLFPGNVQTPAVGATTGRIRVHDLEVEAGTELRLDAVWKAVLANLPADNDIPRRHELYTSYTGSAPAFEALRTPRASKWMALSTPFPQIGVHHDYVIKQGDVRAFICQIAPACIVRNPSGDTELTYDVFWGNLTDSSASSVLAQFVIPEGTTFVRAVTAKYSLGPEVAAGEFVIDDPGTHRREIYPNGVAFWRCSFAPHGVWAGSVTVRVNPGVKSVTTGLYRHITDKDDGEPIFYGDVRVDGSDATLPIAVPVVAASPITVTISEPNRNFDDAKLEVFGTNFGETSQVVVQSVAGHDDVVALRPNTRVMGIGGADFYQFKTGPIAIPIGAGQIVAAGGGNIVAAGGGNINSGGLNLLGQDGASIVAAGGGNLISILGGMPNQLIGLDGASLKDVAASIVAAGGGNIVAAGGGNVVPGILGNIVAAGGGNLLGQDGASLIGQDASSLKFRLVDNDAGTLIAASDFRMLTPGALSHSIDLGQVRALAAQGGPDAKSMGADTMVSSSPGRIVAAGGGNIVAGGGGNLIGKGGAGIVAAGGGNIVAAGGGNVVANDGAGIVAGGGGN